MPNSRPVRLAAFAALLLPITLPAADIVIAPPATGGVAITNAAGSTTRLRVGDDGVVTMPGLGAVPLPATGLCLEVATGRLGTCTVGTLTSLVAGTGLTGGTITSTGTIGIAAAYQLPQACTNGQVPASNGAGAWACSTPSMGGGGTVTSVTASAPLASSGGAAPNISLTGGAAGQVLVGTAGVPAFSGSPSISGNLNLVNSTSTAGNILKSGAPFIHNSGSTDNLFAGVSAGNFTVSGSGNVGLGGFSLNKVAAGSSNTAVGNVAMANATSGSFNVLVGAGVGLGSTMGDFNTVVGANAFGATTTAFQNTGLGGGALGQLEGGSGNTALGYSAGSGVVSGNFNIHVGIGVGNVNETGVIRIGSFLQSKAFLAGVRGVTTDVNDAVGVMIASNGQLGTVSSSRRYKDDIDDMGEASEGLMHLRPVTFHYKSDSDPSGKRLQYGLVAEEVAAVYPGLVARTPDGQSETVMYHFLAPMLVNEVQKQQRTIEAQREELGALRAELADIKRALGLAR